jgi:hypothetical protein
MGWILAALVVVGCQGVETSFSLTPIALSPRTGLELALSFNLRMELASIIGSWHSV